MREYPAPKPSTPISLAADSNSLVDRLTDIRERLTRAVNALHGTGLDEVSGPQEPKPPGVMTVRGNINKAIDRLGEIEQELSRLEGQL